MPEDAAARPGDRCARRVRRGVRDVVEGNLIVRGLRVREGGKSGENDGENGSMHVHDPPRIYIHPCEWMTFTESATNLVMWIQPDETLIPLPPELHRSRRARARAGHDQPGLLAARSADLPPRHRPV